MGAGASAAPILQSDVRERPLHPHVDPKGLAMAALAAARLSQSVSQAEQVRGAIRAVGEADSPAQECRALIALAQTAARQPDHGRPVIAAGGLQCVVDKLAADRQTKVRLAAAHVLTRMARRGPEMREAFVLRHACAPRLEAMARSGDRDLCFKAATAVRALAQDSPDAVLLALGAESLVEALVALLLSHTPEAKAVTAEALARVGAHAETRQTVFRADGAMDSAVRLLDAREPDVQAAGATLVSQMCAADEKPAQRAALDLGVPRKLATLLGSINHGTLHAAGECVAVLGTLGRARVELAEAGVVPLLVRALQVQANEAIRYQATAALLVLSRRPANLAVIGECDGLAALVGMVRTAATPAVRAQAASAARNMLAERRWQDELGRCMGATALVEMAAGAGPRAPAVIALHSAVLGHAGNQEEAVAAGVAAVWLEVVAASADDSERYFAAAALADTAEAPPRREELLAAGALPVLCAAVEDPVAAVRERALEAITSLVSTPPGARAELFDSADALVNVLATDEHACRRGAAGVVMYMAEEEGLAEALIQAGAVAPLSGDLLAAAELAVAVPEVVPPRPPTAEPEAEAEPEPEPVDLGPGPGPEDSEDEDWVEDAPNSLAEAARQREEAAEAARLAAEEAARLEAMTEELARQAAAEEAQRQLELQDLGDEHQQHEAAPQRQREEADLTLLWRATVAIGTLAADEAVQQAAGELGVVEGLAPLLALESVALRAAVCTALSVLTALQDNRWRLHAAGGVPLLARQLREEREDEDVQLFAAWTAARLAGEAEAMRYDLLEAGAAPALARLLGSPAGGVARHAAGALTRLAGDATLVTAAVEAGAAAGAAPLLAHPDELVHHAAVSLVSALSGEPHSADAHRRALLDAGAVPGVAALLQSPSAAVRHVAAVALRSMALEEGCREAAGIECAAAPALVALLGDEPALRQAGADAVAVLAESDCNQAPLREAGAIRPLVGLLDAPERAIQRSAAGALLHLSQDDANRAEVANEGGVHYLIQLLSSRAKGLRSAACAALAELARNPQIQEMIVETDGLEPLVRCAQQPVPSVQQHAARALGHVSLSDATRDKVDAAGATRELVRMLRDEHPKVASEAAFALATMATRPALQKAVALAGAVEPLIALLPPDGDPAVIAGGATALKNLAELTYNKQLIKERGGIAPLIALVDHADHSIVLVALAALTYLAEWEDNQLEVSFVMDALQRHAADDAPERVRQAAKKLAQQLNIAFDVKGGGSRACVIS